MRTLVRNTRRHTSVCVILRTATRSLFCLIAQSRRNAIHTTLTPRLTSIPELLISGAIGGGRAGGIGAAVAAAGAHRARLRRGLL
eukprot:665734-Pyramimonas_sp.AAC.1